MHQLCCDNAAVDPHKGGGREEWVYVLEMKQIMQCHLQTVTKINIYKSLKATFHLHTYFNYIYTDKIWGQ